MKAIVLFSGGLDSTVLLAMVLQAGRTCLALSFNYGQRHIHELDAAHRIASHYKTEHKIITIEPQHFSNTSLLSTDEVPKNRSAEDIKAAGIPSTYVPARNTLFLAYALGQAEILGAQEIYFGANALDSHPYPDCRKEYIDAFQVLMQLATKQAVEGNAPRIVAPFLKYDKVDIIHLGHLLGAPMELSFSCYSPIDKSIPCETCDACNLRREGFAKQSKRGSSCKSS